MPFSYIFWHYRYGVPHIVTLTSEFVRFIFNLFSIDLFFRTLFNPMFSVQISLKDRIVDEDIIAIIISKGVMRIIGALLRSFFILLGLFFIICTVAVMALVLISWIALPLLFLLALYLLVTVVT
jgi:hypothetical protein